MQNLHKINQRSKSLYTNGVKMKYTAQQIVQTNGDKLSQLGDDQKAWRPRVLGVSPGNQRLTARTSDVQGSCRKLSPSSRERQETRSPSVCVLSGPSFIDYIDFPRKTLTDTPKVMLCIFLHLTQCNCPTQTTHTSPFSESGFLPFSYGLFSPKGIVVFRHSASRISTFGILIFRIVI